MDTIKLYEILKKTNLSDEDAHAFVDEILSSVNQKFDEKKGILATKEDLANLKIDITRNLFLASIIQIGSIVGLMLGILKQDNLQFVQFSKEYAGGQGYHQTRFKESRVFELNGD